jgi:hypothetical protein
MNSKIVGSVVCAVIGFAATLQAQTVTIDPTTLTSGYMNYSPVPGDAPGYGGSGSQGWGPAALQANFSGSTLTLAPNVNTYAAGNDYWVNADGSGANIMDASVYSETSGQYVNTTLTFTFDVEANTLVAAYSSVAFIKDFTSNYSSYTSATTALTPGVDSVSLTLSANATDHIQYGFETTGPNANPATASSLGTVVIAPVTVPEPSTLAFAGMGLSAAFAMIRRRK